MDYFIIKDSYGNYIPIAKEESKNKALIKEARRLLLEKTKFALTKENK